MRSDQAKRNKASRGGRQRGCYIYIPAQRLQEAGIDPTGPEPYYRLWAGRRGSLLVTFYREP